MSRYSEPSIRRRDYLIAATTVAGVGVTGCIEGEEGGDGSGDVSADDSGSGPTIERFNASDIERGDEDQRIQVSLVDVDPGEELDVYLDVSSLTESNVEVSDLGVVADAGFSSVGWKVTDAELTVDDGIIVRVRVKREEEIEDMGTLEIDLTGLGTNSIEHGSGLQHHTTLHTNGQPDVSGGETASYDAIIPDELENVLRVRPSGIRIGGDSQEIGIIIQHPTPTIDFRLDLTPLTEAGVESGNAEVVVVESVGEHAEEGEVDIEVTEAEIINGIVHLRLNHGADMVSVDIRILNLETDDAESTDGITYSVYTGERPDELEESGRFSISGATA